MSITKNNTHTFFAVKKKLQSWKNCFQLTCSDESQYVNVLPGMWRECCVWGEGMEKEVGWRRQRKRSSLPDDFFKVSSILMPPTSISVKCNLFTVMNLWRTSNEVLWPGERETTLADKRWENAREMHERGRKMAGNGHGARRREAFVPREMRHHSRETRQ